MVLVLKEMNEKLLKFGVSLIDENSLQKGSLCNCKNTLTVSSVCLEKLFPYLAKFLLMFMHLHFY